MPRAGSQPAETFEEQNDCNLLLHYFRVGAKVL